MDEFAEGFKMEFLFPVLLSVHILVGLGVIGVVLLQHGKGADMGAAFGSGSSGSLFGASGSANFLSRTTAVMATVFFLTSLGLSYIAGSRPKAPSSVMEAPATTVPVPAAVEGKPAESGAEKPAAPGLEKAAPAAEEKAVPAGEEKAAPAAISKDGATEEKKEAAPAEPKPAAADEAKAESKPAKKAEPKAAAKETKGPAEKKPAKASPAAGEGGSKAKEIPR